MKAKYLKQLVSYAKKIKEADNHLFAIQVETSTIRDALDLYDPSRTVEQIDAITKKRLLEETEELNVYYLEIISGIMAKHRNERIDILAQRDKQKKFWIARSVIAVSFTILTARDE